MARRWPSTDTYITSSMLVPHRSYRPLQLLHPLDLHSFFYFGSTLCQPRPQFHDFPRYHSFPAADGFACSILIDVYKACV